MCFVPLFYGALNVIYVYNIYIYISFEVIIGEPVLAESHNLGYKCFTR